MSKASFYYVTQAQHDELVSTSQTIETALYFTSDTHKLYKGANSYSGDRIVINFIGLEENFPESGIEKQIYTKPSTFESRIWKDNAWIVLSLPTSTILNAQSTHLENISAKAVYEELTSQVGSIENALESIDTMLSNIIGEGDTIVGELASIDSTLTSIIGGQV